jgi:hypothetical protein
MEIYLPHKFAIHYANFLFLNASSQSEIASKLATLRMNLIIKTIELSPFHFHSRSAPR